MADHNDPNAINTIFSDVDVSAADLYDLFGLALTFAAIPRAGVLDSDMRCAGLQKQRDAGRRVEISRCRQGKVSWDTNTFGATGHCQRPGASPTLRFSNFPGGSFAAEIDVNQSVILRSPASARRDEVHYYHHLADLYADARKNGGNAVKWAHQDIVLRENFATQNDIGLGALSKR
jgi:hypothetical protein